MKINKKIVVALGGNAILSDNPSAIAQQSALQQTAKHLVNLVKQGYQLIISHGNGPQVGNLLSQQVATDSKANPAMPLDTCVAMTQGSIGYWMQNALIKALATESIQKEVATIVTQVVVDKKDPAFANPTKPIGPFLTETAAKNEMQQVPSTQFKKDAGRGWRKVVPSPRPIDIKEHKIINQLVENDVITISTGGGGIPITKDLQGVEAVIDKDFASEKLAELVDADLFIILTDVDHVAINFGKPNQKELKKVNLAELAEYKEAGHFAPGSMLPKIEAAMQYVTTKPDKKAIITSLESLSNFVEEVVVGTEVVSK